MKKVKNVKVLPGCISCGSCAVVAPEVFHLDPLSQVNKNVDFKEHNEAIEEAADMCPVAVIEVEWEKKSD